MNQWKTIVFGTALVAVALGCYWTVSNLASAAGDEAEARGEIAAVLAAYTEAFEAKDIDGVMATLADGENTVMMGTGPGETWVGKDNIRAAHLAFMATAKKEESTRTLLASGVGEGTAWLAGYLEVVQTLETGEASFQLNLSMVFTKQDGQWRIQCLHFSNLVGEAE